jgi:hypothetical protein
MVASISMLLFTITAGPAFAWTQLVNQFDQTGSGSGQCGNDSSHPCLYWQEPHYTSINLSFIMDPSLNSSQSGYYNFDIAIGNAFNQFINVPAWNPYMYECFDLCSTSVGDYHMTNMLSCGTAAYTHYYWGNVEYGYNPQRGGNEYYTFFYWVDVEFSSSVVWNNNLDWSGDCPHLHWDGRSAALHESGHVIGLGHTNDCPSIMNTGCYIINQLYQLSTNSDIAAVKAIYPGNQQSS